MYNLCEEQSHGLFAREKTNTEQILEQSNTFNMPLAALVHDMSPSSARTCYSEQEQEQWRNGL